MPINGQSPVHCCKLKEVREKALDVFLQVKSVWKLSFSVLRALLEPAGPFCFLCACLVKHELPCPPSYAVGSNMFPCSRLVNSLLFPSCKKVPQEARSTEGSEEQAHRGVGGKHHSKGQAEK